MLQRKLTCLSFCQILSTYPVPCHFISSSNMSCTLPFHKEQGKGSYEPCLRCCRGNKHICPFARPHISCTSSSPTLFYHVLYATISRGPRQGVTYALSKMLARKPTDVSSCYILFRHILHPTISHILSAHPTPLPFHKQQGKK